MTLEVIHADERDALTLRQTLRGHEPHDERADQSRPIRHGDRRNIRPSHVSFFKGFFNEWNQRDGVIATGDFGNNAPVRLMLEILACRNDGMNPAAAFDDGDGGVITAGFNGKHTIHLTSFR
jgi:hypothetical protein